ncbi:MAG: MFS transporter [Rhodoferax sp.]
MPPPAAESPALHPVTGAPPVPPQSQRQRAALAGLGLCMLLSSLGTSIAPVALPALGAHFGVSVQAVQWVVLAYLLSVTCLVVNAGRLGDALGRKRLLLGGLGVFTLASALCSMAPSFALLVAARALQGLGGAAMMALTLAQVGEAVAPERTGRAMGLLGTLGAVGTALGPSVGGLLLAGSGWRGLFLLNLPLGLLAGVLAWRALPADARPDTRAARAAWQPWATALLASAVAAYALAATLGRGAWGWPNALSLGVALLAAGLFLATQARSRAPLLPLALLSERVLRQSLLANAVVAAVMMGTLVVGPFYLSGALGLDAVAVGLVMAVGPVLSTVSGVPAGRLVDRWGAATAVQRGLLAMALGSVALALLPALVGMAGYLGAIALLTPSYQLFHAANNTAVVQAAPAAQRGLVSGLLTLSRNLGLVTGASLLAALFVAGVGQDAASAPASALNQGLRWVFLVAGGGLGVVWARMALNSSQQ